MSKGDVGGSGEGESPLNHPQVRMDLVATGAVDESDLDRFIALCRAPSYTAMSNILMAAWGRRALVNST
jgi:hypothetical protein